MGIKLNFASVAHSQMNEQVEKGNGMICNGIKKRLLAPLEKAKHAWVDELPSMLVLHQDAIVTVLFSAVFVFQKRYTGNILKIG
jgi:hypothetical protein